MGIFKIIVMILDIWLAWMFFSDLMKEKRKGFAGYSQHSIFTCSFKYAFDFVAERIRNGYL